MSELSDLKRRVDELEAAMNRFTGILMIMSDNNNHFIEFAQEMSQRLAQVQQQADNAEHYWQPIK